MFQVQEELAGQKNEFEILDFLKFNFKASVGLERAPAPVSATDNGDGDGVEMMKEEGEEQVRVTFTRQRKYDVFTLG